MYLKLAYLSTLHGSGYCEKLNHIKYDAKTQCGSIHTKETEEEE